MSQMVSLFAKPFSILIQQLMILMVRALPEIADG